MGEVDSSGRHLILQDRGILGYSFDTHIQISTYIATEDRCITLLHISHETLHKATGKTLKEIGILFQDASCQKLEKAHISLIGEGSTLTGLAIFS